MASVTPSESEYKFFKRVIDDFEDSTKSQIKRNKEQTQEKLDDMEKAYKTDLTNREEGFEEHSQKVRDKAGEAIKETKLDANAELEEYKKQVYNKYGKWTGADPQTIQKQLSEAQGAWEKEKKAIDSRNQVADDARLKQIRDASQENEDKIVTAVDKTRRSASEAYNQLTGGNRNALRDQRETDVKTYDRGKEQLNKDIEFEKNKLTSAYEESENNNKHQIAQMKSSNDSRMNRLEGALTETGEDRTKRLTESHTSETGALRNQMKDLIAAEKVYMKEVGQGTADAVKKYENDNNDQKRILVSGYEKLIDGQKDKSDELEAYQAHLYDGALKDKDRKFAGIVARQNLDAHLRVRDLEESFNRNHSQMEQQINRDRDYSRHTLETSLQRASEDRERALINQARAYQETISRNASVAQTNQKELERELFKRKNSEDTSLVSPAAEDAIRKSALYGVEKEIKAAEMRDDARADSMYRRFQAENQETQLDNQSNLNQVHLKHTADDNSNRRQLMQTLENAEFEKKQAMKSATESHEHQVETLSKRTSSTIEGQRRYYEDMLQTQKLDAQGKSQEMRQKFDFEAKMAKRESIAGQNDMMREYERKLSDLQTEQKTRLNDAKEETDRIVRDNERTHKLAIDQQAKNYEHRIAQLEFTAKEREKYSAQVHAEQLEKAKHVNAELIKKKS